MRRHVRNPFRAGQALTLIEALVAVAACAVMVVIIIMVGEHRRRPDPMHCLYNLEEIGRALANYGARNDDYLPCYPGYGADPCDSAAGATYAEKPPSSVAGTVEMSAVIPNSAAQADPRDGTGDNVGAAFQGPSFFRTCFFGRASGPGLRTGPVGLGILLTRGDMADAKLFLCPYAKDMPADWGAANAACNEKDLKKLGGYDVAALTQGDWAKRKGTWQNVPGVYGFQSSYAYRLVPISDAANAASTKVTSVDFDTYPVVTAEVGCPQFKTERAMKGRAIVSDAFSRWDDSAMPKKDRQGFVRYAHHAGYNVLYGDGHSRWFDDADFQIMNWKEDAVPYAGFAEHSSSIAGVTKVAATSPRVYDSTAATPDTNGFQIWHWFDMAEGIDTK